MTTIERPAAAGPVCSICGGRLTAGEEVCPICGALALPAPLEAAVAATCPKCGTAAAAEAHFCENCGASLSKAHKPPRAPSRMNRRFVGAAVGAGVLALGAVAIFVVFRGGGDGEEAVGPSISMPAAGTPDARAVAGLQAVADRMPKPAGATDRDQVRSLLGAPDAFEVAFDLADGGRSETLIRYETWYYFDIESAFEFADGNLIGNMPADDVSPLAILPRQYDPSMFRADMTVADVKKLVAAPESLFRIDAPSELGVRATAYYGEQLMVAFDESGLVLVETYPLQGGGSEQ